MCIGYDFLGGEKYKGLYGLPSHDVDIFLI